MATRPTGYGKPGTGVNSAPISMPDLGGVTDKGKRGNRSTPVDCDAEYPGNVTGCSPKGFAGGKGK